MAFVSNSQDIFFLVLALCVLWLTVLSAWLLYHIISIARHLNQTAKNIKQKMQSLEGVMTLFKNKFTNSTTYITLIASAIAKLITMLTANRPTTKKNQRS